MKGKFKFFIMAITAAVLILSLASCASSKGDYNFAGDSGYSSSPEISEDKLPGNSTGDVILEDRKIIKTVHESIHTDKYDDFLDNLRSTITAAGGYISSARYYGDSYYNDNSLRGASLVVRIPAEKLDEFTSTVDGLAVVYSYSESMSDITAAYVDVESRISVLAAEETALLEMLKLAGNVSETLTIRTRLNEVQSDLASLRAQKKTYDSLVAYSTVNMEINEVRRAESVNPGFFEEVAGKFSDSLDDIGDGLRDFAVWFLGNIIYIIIFAGVVVGIVFIVIKFKRNKKTAKQEDKKEE